MRRRSLTVADRAVLERFRLEAFIEQEMQALTAPEDTDDA